MTRKINGSGKEDAKIVRLPTLAERDRMRRAKDAFDRSQKPKPPPFLNLSKIPPFTRAIIAAFIAVHLFLFFAVDSLPALYDVFNVFGFVPSAFTGGRPFAWEAIASILTHMFIHGNWMHLFVNTAMALVMGMAFEKQYGPKVGTFFFFACGLAGALFYFVLQPFSDSPVIGGSAAISGCNQWLVRRHDHRFLPAPSGGPRQQIRPVADCCILGCILYCHGHDRQ
jgi:membrane associated rhomboid family serine protease